MVILDANAILRYILKDIPEQAKLTAETILNTKILILTEVVAEIVYVLDKHYNLTRNVIADVIIDVLDDTECDDTIIREGVRVFGITDFDFVDCILFARSKSNKIFTFDKKLNDLIKQGPV